MCKQSHMRAGSNFTIYVTSMNYQDPRYAKMKFIDIKINLEIDSLKFNRT